MTMNIWDIMAPAFFELLILVGIHSYLGLHVLKRKVIFVDLALAQIAALGTTVGFLFGIIPGTPGAYWFSLGFAILGAAVFSLTRIRSEKIPQEAVIGLTYAIAAAVSILVIDKAPHGAEHIKELLTGSILWVKWATIGKAAIAYALVGAFHFIFRKKFLLISENPDAAYKQGINVRLWDFLFYVSFGIVITHSVGTAGVLLVFVFLVVPAITSIMITDILWKQLAIGWSMGLIVSVIGLYFSYLFDLPSGPTVVAFYGLILIITALVLYVVRAKARGKALGNIAIGIVVLLVVVGGFNLMGNAFKASHPDHHDEALAAVDPQQVTVNSLAEMSDEQLRVHLSGVSDSSTLNTLFDQAEDDFTRIAIAHRLIEIAPKDGYTHLVNMLRVSDLPFVRDQIMDIVEEGAHRRFGFDADKDADANTGPLEAIAHWINRLK